MPDQYRPEQFKNDIHRAICLGLDCNSPVDKTKEGKFPYLKNVRSYQVGRIEPRYGQTLAATCASSTSFVVAMRRLNDGSNYQHFVATADGSIARGQFSTAAPPTLTVDSTASGFSGNPVTMIATRSMDGASSWMYFFDSAKNMKCKYDGTWNGVGYAAPAASPTIIPGVPFNKIYEDLENIGQWTDNDGSASISQASMFDTTIAQILYDTGTTGWCTIVPAAVMAGLLPGMHMIVGRGLGTQETEMVSEVAAAISSTAITSVVYEDAHWCVVQLNESHENLRQNSIINNSTRSEYARVQSVITAADGTVAIRVYAPSANWAATDTVTGYMSFRIWMNQNHAIGETIHTHCGTITFTAAATNTVTYDHTSAFDLSTLETGATGRASSPEDYFMVALKLDDPAKLDEGKVMIDVDDGGFDNNYYYAVFKPSDLINSIKGTTLTIDDLNKQAKTDATQQNVVEGAQGASESASPTTTERYRAPITSRFTRGPSYQNLRMEPDEGPGWGGTPGAPPGAPPGTTPATGGRDIGGGPSISGGGLDRPGIDVSKIPSRPHAGISNRGLSWWIQDVATGDSQWTVLRIRLKDLSRVGNDVTKTLKDARYIRLQFITNAASLAVSFSSFVISGGFGLDVGTTGIPYIYRYRARNSATGARSNFSPPSRYQFSGLRDYCTVSMPVYDTDLTADYLDVERFGGNEPTWHYVGSVQNILSPLFTDPFSDVTIATSISEGNTNYQPWPVVGTKVSGTATVAGTLLSGSNFKLNWAPGTVIHVEGIPCHIARVHSTTLLELLESAGKQASGASKSWVINAPLILSHDAGSGYVTNHLPVAFGPFEGHILSVGDPLNPGTLYWTNPYSPDSASDSSRLEVTAPSEPLMNGCVYNGRCYLFSSERMFQVLPAFESLEYWRVIEVPGGVGLRTRWGISSFNQAEGPLIWYVGRDGLYQTDGAAPENVTNEDLMPLFPNEGNPGTSQTIDSNVLTAPSYVTSSKHKYHHLCYHDGYLYYDYTDETDYRTLVFQPELKCWWYDVYGVASNVHYGEEGSGIHNLYMGSMEATSHIYHFSGTADGGGAIAGVVITPAYDQGAPRNKKMYGDRWLDYSTGNAAQTLSFKTLLSNFSTSLGTDTVAASATRTSASYAINSGASQEGLNIGHVISWSSALYTPKIYQWGESFYIHPTDTGIRFTEFDDAGTPNDKWVQGVLIEADTYNVAKTVRVMDENSVVRATLTIQHNGRIIKPYSWPGFFSHTMRLAPSDSTEWELFDWTWKFEPAPELTTTWESPDMTHGLDGFQHLRDGYVAHVSTANLTLTVTVDGTQYTYTIAHNSGAYKKSYIVFQAVKGKYHRYKLTSAAGFRLYQQDSEVHGKIWGGQTQYHTLRPFGGTSLEQGARI